MAMTVLEWAERLQDTMPPEQARACYDKCLEVLGTFWTYGLEDATDSLTDFMDVFLYAVETTK